MSTLSSKKRNRMKSTSFAIPGERAYPIMDKNHAKNAFARVAQFGTPSERAKVRAAVYRKFPSLKKGK